MPPLTDAQRRRQLAHELAAITDHHRRPNLPGVPGLTSSGLNHDDQREARLAAAERVADAHRAEHRAALAAAKGAGPATWRAACAVMSCAYPDEYRAAVVVEVEARARSTLTLPAVPTSLGGAAVRRVRRRALTRLACAHPAEYLALLAEETGVERARKEGAERR